VIVREVEIRNPLGLHARAAARFVHTANHYRSQVRVSGNGKTMDGKSILGILLLAASQGTRLRVTAEGEDEVATVEALVALIENDFVEGA